MKPTSRSRLAPFPPEVITTDAGLAMETDRPAIPIALESASTTEIDPGEGEQTLLFRPQLHWSSLD